MNTWIAFLKSINVGGNNLLTMKELRDLSKDIGLQNFTSYIQSGNCVFQSNEDNPSKLEIALSNAVFEAKGFKPPVLVLSREQLENAIANNPFQVAPPDRNKVHFHFPLGEDQALDFAAIASLRLPSEQLDLVGKVLYLHAPDGVGRSKLFASLPKFLVEDVTVRNLKTTMKVRDLAADF